MRSKFSFFRFLPVLPFLCLLAVGLSHTALAKVSATIILASVEGEVKALSLDEDLELTLDESFVGKSVDENFILTTGKNGKAVFLFSNGVLVTLKPNTRLYVRTFVQESFSSKNVPPPGELEEEPSTSHLKIHLDTGDLVVKAPKLKRGSSFNLTSPLGTAGIRGTMFQIVVARDPDTGTVSGGVNLISGDIDFTDVSGDVSILASGQGLEVSTGKLGDSSGGVSGELRDLSAKFGPALAGTGTFPPIVAPPDTETLPPEGVVAPEAPAPTVGYLPRENGWGSIHDIATDTFFEIEEAEFSVSSVTFDAIESSVSVDTPTPALTAPTVPAAISGGDMAPPDPFFGGAPKVALKGEEILEWEMGIPFADPGFITTDFSGAEIATKLTYPPNVSADIHETPGPYELFYASNDFRGFKGSATRTVNVVATPPTITLKPGKEAFPKPNSPTTRPSKVDPTGVVVYHSVKSRNPLFPDSGPFQDPGFTAATASLSNPDWAGQPLWGSVQVEGASISYDDIGTFDIKYTVNDQMYRSPPSGISTTVKRKVHIADLTPPKVFLQDSLSVEVEASTSYTDAGAFSLDNYDLKSYSDDPQNTSWKVINNINLEVEDVYSVEYVFTDVARNESETVKRLVTVVDTTPPVIELFGSPVIFVDFNSTYRDPGAYATDTRAKDLTEKINVTDPVAAMFPDLSDPLNPIDPDPDKKKIGTYTVTYTVSDGAKTENVVSVTREVVVLGNDGQGPQMRLFPPTEENGTKHLIVNVGDTYNDPGAYAFKDLGTGDVKYYKVTRLNDPDMSKLGETKIHYLSYDEFGNEMRISRSVEVQDMSAPVVYPNKSDGQTDLALEAGVSYRDDGASAIDNYKGDLTAEVQSDFYRITEGTSTKLSTQEVLDMQVVGFVDPDPAKGYSEYRVVYTVDDGSKNSPDGDANRTLMVYDTTAPVGDMLAVTSESSFVFASDSDKTFKVVGDNSKVVFPEDLDWGSTVKAKLKASESPDYGRTEVVALGFRLLKDTGESFDDPGVKFSDNAKGLGLDEDAITVEHTELAPDAGIDKQYRITYKAVDAFGNLSMVYERIIKVLSGPRVTLLGESEIVVVNKYNQTELIDYAADYKDQGATAKDALGVDITNSTFLNYNGLAISYYFDAPPHDDAPDPDDVLDVLGSSFIAARDSLGSQIDLTKTGKYEIFYMATDENINKSPLDERELPEKSRIVYSIADDGIPPEITPLRNPADDGFVHLEVNATGTGTYAELGATAVKTRHAGRGLPYEVVQVWDETNSTPTVEVSYPTDFKFTFGKGSDETKVRDTPYVITYSVKDEFGNEGTATLSIKIEDNISPTIVAAPFPYPVEAGENYVDPGFTASDNYDLDGALTATVKFFDKDGSEVGTVDSYSLGLPIDTNDTARFPLGNPISTWDLDKFSSFKVVCSVADVSGNTKDYTRNVTVTDTTAPTITLNPVPDPLPNAGSLGSGDLSPIRVLQDLSAATPAGAANHYIEHGITVTDNSWQPGDSLSIVASGSLKTGLSAVTVTIVPNFDMQDMQKPGQYKVTYTATDSSGKVSTLERLVDVLDRENPNILGDSTLSDTSPPSLYVVAEGGVQYDDDSGQTVQLWDGTNFVLPPQALSLYAEDVQDGAITAKIKRTIFYDKNKDGTFSESENKGFILNNDVASVPSLISTSIDHNNTQYLIKYEVTDEADNNATVQYRRIIVKDTMAPSIQPSSFETTVLVDYKSIANPKVSDPADVKNFLVNGFSAVDANNFDPNLSWVVDINKTNASGEVIAGNYVVGEIFPETRNDDGPGYKITIKVKDSSGNVSSPVVRYLKVGDFTPPTLTMMGKSEIHDFFRFGKNPTANATQLGNVSGSLATKNAPFLDRPLDASTNPDYDATGFSGGAHRMMLAEYNFTDPGVYAEDENADWALSKGNPDLNGNGVGEGFATVRVSDRADMDTCSGETGLIHVYSFMEQSSSAQKIKHWQALMKAGTYGYNTSNEHNATFTPAKVPDVDDEDTTINRGVGNEYEFFDLNKSDLTNFDMTIITIEYRVKDHWDNLSSIATRLVYFYESRQFGNYAFYATPLTDAGGQPFEDYDNNGSVGMNPVLSGARKDTDGDGVSDFWEFALGTDPERVGVPGDPDKYTPDFADPLTFRNTSASPTDLSKPTLNSNLGRMNAGGRLTSARGIGDFNATVGL